MQVDLRSRRTRWTGKAVQWYRKPIYRYRYRRICINTENSLRLDQKIILQLVTEVPRIGRVHRVELYRGEEYPDPRIHGHRNEASVSSMG